MQAPSVSTTTERLGTDRVKLRVEVPEDALGPAINAVYRRWAGEIKVPGFRKGKVPRQLIDARVGPEAVREEALKDALPDFYREAMRAEDLHALAPPDIDVVTFEPGSPLVFEATVDVRPDIELPDFSSLRVDMPEDEVTDADLNEQLDRLRDRFAELETASREARRGDHVLIDLKGSVHDEPVEGASAPDYLYEVGSRTGPAKLDEEIEGNRAGAILKFTDTVPQGEFADQEITFTVLIKEVKAKKLPALDDEFAKTVGEFDTLEELKEDIRSKISEVKSQMAEEELRRRVLEELVSATDLTPPEKLVEGEFEHRLHHFEDDLKRAGLTIDDYGRETQLTELEIRRDIRDQAARGIKAELILEEIATRNEIQITDEDLGLQIAVMAARAGREPKEVAEEIAKSGRLGALTADIMRRKALDLVVDSVNVIGRRTDER
jgi:trigger factor